MWDLTLLASREMNKALVPECLTSVVACPIRRIVYQV